MSFVIWLCVVIRFVEFLTTRTKINEPVSSHHGVYNNLVVSRVRQWGWVTCACTDVSSGWTVCMICLSFVQTGTERTFCLAALAIQQFVRHIWVLHHGRVRGWCYTVVELRGSRWLRAQWRDTSSTVSNFRQSVISICDRPQRVENKQTSLQVLHPMAPSLSVCSKSSCSWW